MSYFANFMLEMSCLWHEDPGKCVKDSALTSDLAKIVNTNGEQSEGKSSLYKLPFEVEIKPNLNSNIVLESIV